MTTKNLQHIRYVSRTGASFARRYFQKLSNHNQQNRKSTTISDEALYQLSEGYETLSFSEIIVKDLSLTMGLIFPNGKDAFG
jgi:hypothetical protein